MHLRCCVHILNLIVTQGLKEIDSWILKIRAACKYVKSSPARQATFRMCVTDANTESRQGLCLDVPTMWNSTYLMLEAAEKYEKAFARYEYDEPSFVNIEGGTPSSYDWLCARVFVKFLKIFYDATLTFF